MEKKKKRKETKKNIEAFKMYCKLKDKDEKDIFKKIGDKFGRKEKTIYNWSSLYNWSDRHREIEEKAMKEALEQLAKDKEKQDKRTIQKIMQNLRKAEDNVEGTLDGAYSPKDYETMVKLYLLLTDRPTERTESNNKQELSLQDKQTLEQISKNITKDIKEAEIGMKEEK